MGLLILHDINLPNLPFQYSGIWTHIALAKKSYQVQYLAEIGIRKIKYYIPPIWPLIAKQIFITYYDEDSNSRKTIVIGDANLGLTYTVRITRLRDNIWVFIVYYRNTDDKYSLILKVGNLYGGYYAFSQLEYRGDSTSIPEEPGTSISSASGLYWESDVWGYVPYYGYISWNSFSNVEVATGTIYYDTYIAD